MTTRTHQPLAKDGAGMDGTPAAGTARQGTAVATRQGGRRKRSLEVPSPKLSRHNFLHLRIQEAESGCAFQRILSCQRILAQVTDDSSHHYQGWSIPHIADTEWHVVRVYFDEETLGTGGEPKVSSEGQLTDFEYGGSVMWFDCTYFS
jgi:hypothetical protein